MNRKCSIGLIGLAPESVRDDVRRVATAAAFTFLFTDLEGSTRRWERDAERMDRWLAAHDEILTRAIGTSGGRVFKHTGDGLCAVYPTPVAAAAGALALQRALAAAGHAVVGPLRVRVAVHAGEARERGGDFYGPTLNRCARLLEIAHGGQVLLSATVAATLAEGGALAGDASLSDMGRHRLRDLQQPERVWQLGAPDLETAFPPLRSLDAFTHNLPVQRSSFVGRERECAALTALLGANRLVTITGVGGCGKTRLALEVAARLLDAFGGGVFFVDLSTQMEPASVTSTILGALRLAADAGAAEERLRDFLSDRRCLLLLDNCEHLLDACAEVADRLLSACGELTLLATSREPLGLDGEQVWRVPSLALPAGDAADEVARSEAGRLFVDRAAAIRPGFALGADAAAAVARICRRLDGIPLAIELAAARMTHLSPQEVEARLADRFRLLSGGRRGVQRQQTLQAVLDWSHDLLSDPERALLRRLSVFAGGWTLAAAQGICAGGEVPDDEVVQLLGALVARSLVEAHADGARTRYRLLETVRLYAQDRLLATGEAERLRAAHAAWFAARAAACTRGGPWFPPLIAVELDAEVDNLRQAIDWWRDTGDLERMALLAASTINEFHTHARFDEVEDWLQTALGRADLPRPLRARCLSAWAIAAEMRGDFLAANDIARQAMASAEQPADAGGAYALLAHNLVWMAPAEAERLLDSSAAWTAPLGPAAAAVIGAIRAMLACAREEYEQACAHIAGASAASDAGVFGGPAGGIEVTVRILGGQLDTAEAILDGLHSWGDRWPLYYVPLLRGIIAARRGDPALARQLVGEAVAHSRRWRVPLAAADGLLGCAAIAFHAGRIERASELLACVSAATNASLRSPMSMCFYRYYRGAVRAALDAETVARARRAGAQLSVDAALAAELQRSPSSPLDD